MPITRQPCADPDVGCYPAVADILMVQFILYWELFFGFAFFCHSGESRNPVL
jgi:hypothetical protein